MGAHRYLNYSLNPGKLHILSQFLFEMLALLHRSINSYEISCFYSVAEKMGWYMDGGQTIKPFTAFMS